MDSKSASFGFQFNSDCMRSLLATKMAGSPARRGASCVGMRRPTTFSTVDMTSRTLKPFPFPNCKRWMTPLKQVPLGQEYEHR